MSKTCNKFTKDKSKNESFRFKDISLSNTNYSRFNNLKSNSAKNI